MKCPHCDGEDSSVLETRESDTAGLRRRRECSDCGERFTTYERVETPSLTVVKSDGSEEAFRREKLRGGIEKACQKRDISDAQIDSIVDEVETELKSSGQDTVDSDEIGDHVVEKLREVDEVAYVRFASVYNSFDDVSAFEEEVETLKAS
ncbi:MAG: transcriptional regulator NrdR [Candidatus Nanohaloarchaea archaeon]|nr:transcriptional regulator NrdR [Candidatus Nanohaloarchaea archaeon]